MTESDDTDKEVQDARGRTEAQHALDHGTKRHTRTNTETTLSSTTGRPSHRQHRDSSVSRSGGSRRSSPIRMHERGPFTRSRSPAVHLIGNGFVRPGSPSLGARQKTTVPVRALLPATINITFPILLTKTRWMVSIDVRQAAENLLLLCSLGYCADKIRALAGDPFSPDMWLSIGKTPRSTPHRFTSHPVTRAITPDYCVYNLLLCHASSMVKSNPCSPFPTSRS